MPLRIFIIPASTQAGSSTIRSLLSNNADVHITDFSDADAVFYIPPVTYDGSSTADFATSSATRVKSALSKSSVKRLLVFSAMGSQYEGIGILKANTITDRILAQAAPEVVIAHGAWFMENWASALSTIEGEDPYLESFVTPTSTNFGMISMTDVGAIAARLVLETGQTPESRPQHYTLHGPRLYSPDDVGRALEKLIGKSIRVVGVVPKRLQEYYQAYVHPVQAKELAEMTLAMNAGGVVERHMHDMENVIHGEIGLEEALARLISGQTTKAASGAF